MGCHDRPAPESNQTSRKFDGSLRTQQPVDWDMVKGAACGHPEQARYSHHISKLTTQAGVLFRYARLLLMHHSLVNIMLHLRDSQQAVITCKRKQFDF